MLPGSCSRWRRRKSSGTVKTPFLEKCSSPAERKTYYQCHCCFWASLGKPFNIAAGRADELLWSRVGVPTSSPTSARAASRTWDFSDGGLSSLTMDISFLRYRGEQTLQGLRTMDIKSRVHLWDPVPALSKTSKNTQTSQSPSPQPNKILILPQQSSARSPTDGTWGEEQKTKTSEECPEEQSPPYPVWLAPSPTPTHTAWERGGKKNRHLASLRFSKYMYWHGKNLPLMT